MSGPRNCSFSAALSYLKAGLRVTRAGWNGKGAWLTLVAPDPGRDGSEYEPPDGYYAVHLNVGGGSSRTELTERTPVGLRSWIGLKTAADASGIEGLEPWIPSQTDLLAEDWEVVS